MVKKSQATIVAAWVVSNWRHVGPQRRGAGSSPACWRFSVANRRTSSRTTQAVGGRPGGVAVGEVHLRATSSRCQRSRQRSQHGPVGRARSRTGDLAAQHAHLMAQDQDLDVPCLYPCGHATPAVRTVGVSVDTPARRSRRASRPIRPTRRLSPAPQVIHPEPRFSALTGVLSNVGDPQPVRFLDAEVTVDQIRAGLPGRLAAGRAAAVQMARNLVMDLQDTGTTVKYLIRDRDSRYTAAFDAVLADSGITTITTGIRVPRTNAIMKR
jgi:hypothetical protein